MALPEYDPNSGINPFDWILEASKAVRAERMAAASKRQLFSQLDRVTMQLNDAQIDAEDDARLKNLRRQYDPARNRATNKVA